MNSLTCRRSATWGLTLAACLFSYCTAQTPESAEDRTTAARWLPADTVAVARVADVEQFRQQWHASSFGHQFNDPAFAEFFAEVTSRLSGISHQLGIDLPSLWDQIDGELTIGLLRQESGGMSVLATASFADESAADRFTAQLENRLSSEHAERVSVTLDKRELLSWQRNEAGVQKSLCYFREGNQIIFSDGLEALATAAARASEPGATLSDNQNFLHVMQQVSAGDDRSGIQYFVNPEAVVSAAVTANLSLAQPQPAARELMDRLGLDRLKGYGGSFWLGKAGMDSVSRTYGYVETPLTGVWRAFAMPAIPQRPPNWVKEDVSLYSQINFGADRFVSALSEVIEQTQAETTGSETSLQDLLSSLPLGDSGRNAAELLGQLKGPIHIAAEIPQDAAELVRQQAVIAIEVEDPALMRDWLRDVAAAAGATAMQTSAETPGEIYQLSFESVEMPQLPDLGLAFTVAEGSLMLSPNPDYLRRVATGNDTRGPLSESASYREIAAQFPAETSAISYQRQDGRIEGLYEQLRSGVLSQFGLPGVAGSLLNFDFTKLPPYPAMSRYLQSSGSFILPQEDGFQIVSFAAPPREQ